MCILRPTAANIAKVAEGVKKRSWLSFVSEHATTLLAGESDAVKEEVEKYLEKATIEHPGLEMFTEDPEDAETTEANCQDRDLLRKRALEIQT